MSGIASEGLPVVQSQQAQQKVKYFGTILPPKCEFHGCFLTDDGQHFYCTDFTCNKHKYRRTKHDRYSRYEHLDKSKAAAKAKVAAEQPPVEQKGFWPLVYFKCPRCQGRDIQMRVLRNRYECTSCEFIWK